MDWIYDLKRKDFDNVKSYRLTSKEELEDIGGFVIIPNESQHFLKDRYGDYESSARPSNIVFINKWYEFICKIEYVESVCYGNEFVCQSQCLPCGFSVVLFDLDDDEKIVAKIDESINVEDSCTIYLMKKREE